jgi:hypothetical protein
MAVNRQLGVNAAIVLKFGTVDQATVKGLNQLTLPALTRSKIKSEEFGVDFAVNDVGGGEHGDISYGGNAVFGDTKGQDQLKAYLKANTKFTDARVYIDTVAGHFLAPDLANDTAAGFQVIAHTPGSVNKNGTFPFTGAWSVNGLYAIFTVHRPDVATPKLAFVISATPLTVGGTITDSTSQFVINGFVAGQTLIVEGSTSCNGVYKIKTVAAGTLTLEVLGTGNGTLTTEAALATTVLHAGIL